MSADPVRRIADAVLYEGYLLWPYRKSALKNQQRFNFGGVHPPAFPDRSALQAEVLLEGDARAGVEVRLRFLQVVRRQVLEHDPGAAAPRPVEELEAGGERWISWDEAVERELGPGQIAIAAGARLEPIPGGVVRRSWEALSGRLTVTREPLHEGLSRVRVRVENTSAWTGSGREQALRHTLCSAHAVMRARQGSWVSLTDPPARLRAQADACVCEGWWPVLVGEEGQRSTMLAAPIILPDHPEVAPESPGDLFDSAEIDQMLVLNILAMTEEERRDMRDSDPRAREILRRTERLTREQMMNLHGTVRR